MRGCIKLSIMTVAWIYSSEIHCIPRLLENGREDISSHTADGRMCYDGSRGVRICAASCLSLFSHDISKTRQIGSPNRHLTWHGNVPRWLLEIYLFCGQKVKGQKSRSRMTKTLSAWVFVLFWLMASSGFILFLTRAVHRLGTTI